jgi:hypothetical protein
VAGRNEQVRQCQEENYQQRAAHTRAGTSSHVNVMRRLFALGHPQREGHFLILIDAPLW